MTRNGILKHGILMMAGALALGACGGRQNDQQTTTQPGVTDPAQTGTTQGQGTTGQDATGQGTTGQDTTGQGTTGQDTTGQDTAGPDPTGTPTPDQHMTGQGMHGQDMHGQGMGQDQGMHGTGTQGMHGQGTQGQATQGQATQGQMGQPAMVMQCPTDVQGTTARTTQTKRGITIAFTTRGGDVAEVRRRVQHLAEMHNQHHAQLHAQGAQGTMHDQTGAPGAIGSLQQDATQAQTGTGGQTGAQAQTGAGGQTGTQDVLAMTQAKAENMPRGARLVLTVREPGQIERLREQLRIHAQNMAAGQCDMMSGQGMPGQGATPGTTGTTGQPAGQGTSGQPRTR